MSHIIKGAMVIKDLTCLQRACDKLNLKLRLFEGKRTMRSRYGASVHDCIGEIKVSNEQDPVYIRQDENGYHLEYDPYGNTLEKVLGPNLTKLSHEYGKEVACSILGSDWSISCNVLPDNTLEIRCFQI